MIAMLHGIMAWLRFDAHGQPATCRHVLKLDATPRLDSKLDVTRTQACHACMPAPPGTAAGRGRLGGSVNVVAGKWLCEFVIIVMSASR
jgi:hypothetical protein